jgi:hypothetical protein
MLLLVFERFTETARQVVVKAQEEARGLNHNYIGTEHVLLGLLLPQDRIADRVLLSFGITADLVRDQVVKIVGSGEEATAGQIPFTPRAKKVLELGLREALSLGHNTIGPEHLLLGLLCENDGVGMGILRESGVDPRALREAVIELVPGPDREWPRPVSSVGPAQPGIVFTVMPDGHCQRVLMRACALALADARTEFTVPDLLLALWGDKQAAEEMTALVAGEAAAETTEGPDAESGEPGATPSS